MPLLELKQVTQYKSQQKILSDINIQINQQDIVALLGASGAGKTTLFRLLNMLDSPTEGEILYQGQNLKNYNPMALRRQIGYLIQKPLLFGKTVRENLYYPYEVTGEQPEESIIEFYLRGVGLDPGVLTKNVSGLSGGEQQRIGLVRLLLVKPKVLLLDEFTAALDEENTIRVESLILSEIQEKQLTVLFITHNTAQSSRLANRLIRLEKGVIQTNE